jgi:hypothetical protein
MLFVQLSKYSISMEIHPRMAWIYQIAGGAKADPRHAWMARTVPTRGVLSRS